MQDNGKTCVLTALLTLATYDPGTVLWLVSAFLCLVLEVTDLFN